MYIALKHAQLAVDIVIEEGARWLPAAQPFDQQPVYLFGSCAEPDAIAGHLEHYHTLYVVDRHVSEHAMGSIMAWVKTGGVAFIEAGGGGLNEFNETNAARAAVAPFQTLGMWTGGIAGNINRSIM